MKFIDLWQVAEQHIPFVFQGRGDEVAELRVVQLCEITLERHKTKKKEDKIVQLGPICRVKLSLTINWPLWMIRLNYGANNHYNNYVIIKQSAVDAQTIRVKACQ